MWRTVLLCGLILGSTSAPAAIAQAGSSFVGTVFLGVRNVDVTGSVEKYRQHIDLREGVRLLRLALDYVPLKERRDWLGYLRLEMRHLGGDPFEGIDLVAGKASRWDLKYQRRRSDFFYRDVFLSGQPDLHSWDFRRIRDRVSLGFDLTQRAHLELEVDRSSRDGAGSSTLEIAGQTDRLVSPLEEDLREYRVGFGYDWNRWTIQVEGLYREFDNSQLAFLPEPTDDGDGEDRGRLESFVLAQPYDLTGRRGTLRVSGRPGRRLTLRAAAVVEDSRLEGIAEESGQGEGAGGRPFVLERSGGGQVNRDWSLLDLDFSVLVTRKLALVGALRRHELDQNGSFRFGEAVNLGEWSLETVSGELALQYSLTKRLTFGAGKRRDERTVDYEQGVVEGRRSGREIDSDDSATVLSLGWRPSKALRLDAEVEDISYDNPLTTTSPTSLRRYRLKGSARARGGLYASLGFLRYDLANRDSGWEADRVGVNLRLGYRKGKLQLGGGYADRRVERGLEQQVTANGQEPDLSFIVPVFYESDSRILDLHGVWRGNRGLRFSGRLQRYRNRGSVALDRDDHRVGVEYLLRKRYLLSLGYRHVDYDEEAQDINDYQAEILEVALGYQW